MSGRMSSEWSSTPLVVDELDDGGFCAVCPFCGLRFEGDSHLEVAVDEGVHRAENHIDSDERIKRSDNSGADDKVDEWKSGLEA